MQFAQITNYRIAMPLAESHIDVPEVTSVSHARFVVIALASTITGLTKRAIEGKIRDGHWLEGKQYRRAPDGRLYIDMEGYTSWVRGPE